MNIKIEFNTTEFRVYPDEKNQSTVFNIDHQSMVISFLDKDSKVLSQSEIELSDAKILAQQILSL